MPRRGVLTLGDNLPSRRGLTWRRGYERAVSSAWDKDRPHFSSFFSSRLPSSPTPPLCPARSAQPPFFASSAPCLARHPYPECLLCTSRLIAHFCKLVSISMLHLLPFNIFARPCRKKRGAQHKANPPSAPSGKPQEPPAEQKRGEGLQVGPRVKGGIVCNRGKPSLSQLAFSVACFPKK